MSNINNKLDQMCDHPPCTKCDYLLCNPTLYYVKIIDDDFVVDALPAKVPAGTSVPSLSEEKVSGHQILTTPPISGV